ncbi:MAG: hypothetical protein ACOWWM_12720 [Desulfobacterales bacterium]
MIALWSDNYSLVIDEDLTASDMRAPEARVQRDALIDGTVHIAHYGVSHGDRTFRISPRSITEAQEETLRAMQENDAAHYLGTGEGAFSGVLSGFGWNRGRYSITFLPDERMHP